MKLVQLQYFVTTVKYNSITKAAKKLYVSQPAISNAIKELEDEFNTTLFKRNNNVIFLTEQGKYLYSLATSLLNRAQRVENEMREFVKNKEVLKIVIPPFFGVFLIPLILDVFSKSHPHIEVDVEELGSFENRKKVLENEIDLSLTVVEDMEKISTNLDYIILGKISLLFLVNKSHKLANRKSITFKDLENMPLLLMKEDTLQSHVVAAEFQKLNVEPNIKIRTNQLYTIKEMVSNNKYGAFFFEYLLKEDDNLVTIPFEPNIQFNIILAWNKKTTLDKLAIEFIRFFRGVKIEFEKAN